MVNGCHTRHVFYVFFFIFPDQPPQNNSFGDLLGGLTMPTSAPPLLPQDNNTAAEPADPATNQCKYI